MTSTAEGATTAAVVLAAGGGTRFRGTANKLLADLDGRALVRHAVDAALAAGLDEVIVVTGAVDVAPYLPPGVRVVHNPEWAEGMATSLQAGIAAAEGAGHDAVVVGLGDQPGLGPEPWRAVAAATSPIAVATYHGRRRNPVRLHREVWPLLPTAGDEGARVLFRVRSDLVGEVPCVGEPADIDTLEDLERWN
ncbi:MAG: nucleotidyltransferase family protein [Acidimicrobiales bacterium]|nr:nucleotidyltransferase family protein [Acidimicrobiales bacterium]